MNAITVKALTKIYKIYQKQNLRLLDALDLTKKPHGSDFYALDGIDFAVEKGTTLGIIGENGAGKSTLLKIMTGVLQPTAGEVQINGKVSALLELGTGFHMEYTGIENLYLNGTINGLTQEQIEAKIPQIVAFADIGDFIHHKVKTYSSGMFARLAFAAAVHIEPEILIVDEALSVGDLFFQQKCNLYMKEKMEYCTKLLVTHDMASIANMADQVLVLQKGKQVFYGEPLQAIEFYTKSIHTDLFHKKEHSVSREVTGCREERGGMDHKDMTQIPADSLGGAMEVQIRAYQILVNEKEYPGYVRQDDEILVRVHIVSEKTSEQILIGYQVKDKYGNAIFGENTHSSGFAEAPVKQGKNYIAKIRFRWPQIQENTYFLTLGVGEGNHEMQHVIQCWAHNICELKSIADAPDHGLFNQKIEAYQITEIIDGP